MQSQKPNLSFNPNMGNPGLNIEPNVVVQPSTQPLRKKTFKDDYVLTLGGIVRMILILCLLAGVISAAATIKMYTTVVDEYVVTRDAYLGISITGFIVSIILFIMNFLNIIEVKILKSIPWNITALLTDLLWLIPMFIVSIVCAVKEGNAKDLQSYNATYINTGSFAAASFFGFVASLLFGIDAGYFLIKVIRKNITN